MGPISPPTSGSNLRSNIRNLYWDVFWWGILGGSILAFLGVYATRIGASNFQVGLLTAGPAVGNLLVSLPVGRWLENRSLIRATFWSSIAQRAGYVPLIFLPWLLTAPAQIWTIELLVLLMSVPGTMLAIGFNSMLVEVVPPRERGQVVGWRNALVAISLTAASLVCGRLLDWIPFPLNYQVVFAVGAAGGAMSSFHLGRIRGLRSPVQPAARPSPGARKPLLRLDLLRGSFGPFIAVYLLFYVFQNTPIPLFPLAFVRELHLTDGTISLGNALFYGTMFLASTQLGRLTKRWGHRRVLILGALFYGLYPLLIAMARDAALFWAASFLGGAAWGLTGAGLINRLMERVPPDDLPAHMALHNLALNVGMLSGSLIGPALGDAFGLREALFVSAGLRLLGGVLLGLWA
jgi:MFS family permease